MSNSVRLRDLNDFIAPSQKCVNPLFSDKTGGQDNENGSASAGGGLVLQLEPDEVVQETTAGPETKKQQIRPDLIKLTTKQKATVTLNDCLACSGCITSAETLLIQVCRKVLLGKRRRVFGWMQVMVYSKLSWDGMGISFFQIYGTGDTHLLMPSAYCVSLEKYSEPVFSVYVLHADPAAGVFRSKA